MPLEEAMESMRASLQSSLDELASPRGFPKSKLKALQSIEKSLATACFSTENDSEAKDCYLALQYTFECNVPSHLLSWITISTSRLEHITNKGSMDGDQELEAEELSSQLALSLSLIQGTVLNHEPSKRYLGRKSALETLLDLLLASRHLAPSGENGDSKSKSTSTPHLTSIVLDTLLCVLVDSTAALRAFEAAHGVQAIVKILKRAGTPREVRMKCLEFLYFYLLDETPSATSALVSTQATPPPTAPATPIRPPKPYLSGTPMRPTSRYGSSTFSFSGSSNNSLSLSGSSATSSSSRSTSGSSTKSFSSTSSNASSSTTASSMPASPVKESAFSSLAAEVPVPRSPTKRVATPSTHQHRSPPTSPPFSSSAKFPQLRSMMLLRKDVDYVPQSPRKSPGLSPRPTHQKSLSGSSTSLLSRSQLSHSRSRSQATLLDFNDGNNKESTAEPQVVLPLNNEPVGNMQEVLTKLKRDENWKTTEEKKELLGTMLGNVDALVESVRKAGIWGLG